MAAAGPALATNLLRYGAGAPLREQLALRAGTIDGREE